MRKRTIPYVLGISILFSNIATAETAPPTPEEFKIFTTSTTDETPANYLGLAKDYKICAKTLGALFRTQSTAPTAQGMCVSTDKPEHIYYVKCSRIPTVTGSTRVDCMLREEYLPDISLGYAPGSSAQTQLRRGPRLNGDL